MDASVLARTMAYVAAPDSASAPITVAEEMTRMRVRREDIVILFFEVGDESDCVPR